MSGFAWDTASYTGANWRQGPHQAAQKSTRTMGLPSMVSAKVDSLTLIVVMEIPYGVSNG
jgi:hypothetical protein